MPTYPLLSDDLTYLIENQKNANIDTLNLIHLAYINEHRKLKWVTLYRGETSNGDIYFWHKFDEQAFIISVNDHKANLERITTDITLFHPLERLLMGFFSLKNLTVLHSVIRPSLLVNININDISIQDFRKKGSVIAFKWIP